MTRYVLLILGLVTMPGCGADFFSARSRATYEAYGAKLTYDSSKNQENFKAKVGFNPDGSIKELDLQTTASTAESAIAAAMQAQAGFLDAMKDFIKEIAPLAKAAAMSGS